ncbi:MAG: hypothetical protein HRT71_17725 [Flavobacteriales bacterium]|nr:hypothetical protein [Flavobacteriales bacterium]
MSKRNKVFSHILTIAVLILLASQAAYPQCIKKSTYDYSKDKYQQKNYTKFVYYSEINAARLE